jgi:hypothetical protein
MSNCLFFTVVIMIVYYIDELTTDSFNQEHEDFALSSGIITDKSLVQSNVNYQIGTLNPGIVSTITDAVAGGKPCDPLPEVVYKPV